jgi:hypothetical protein
LRYNPPRTASSSEPSTDKKLQFVGIVDNGVEPKLIAVLEEIEQAHPPFAVGQLPRGPRYVQPRLVANVKYMARANSLRHSRLRGVRISE